MKHGLAFRKLSRTSSHRTIMLRNLVSSLLEHGQIKTTVAKAKETARLAEKIITLGKRGDAYARSSAEGFLFKPEITLPLLFGEYATRYSSRPGGYTRIHKYGHRPGDNAPSAIVELVDGPRDIRFEMTARAVGRETVEAALKGQNGGFDPSAISPSGSGSSLTSSGEGKGSAAVPLRELTKSNLAKVLRYRSAEDKAHFRQLAAQWANRILAEPKAASGLRHPVQQQYAPAQDPSESAAQAPVMQRHRYPFTAVEGKRPFAGERLLGVEPSKASSPLAVARGKLGAPRPQTRSEVWESATREAVQAEKARGGAPTIIKEQA